jgi:hypothetical protein
MNANLFRSIVVMAALTAFVRAQTFNWGSEVLSDLRKSNGGIPDETTFKFELGAFNAGFDPNPGNLASWFLNWHVFDTADYNRAAGYFTSTAQMLDNGSSSYLPAPPADEFNFDLLANDYLNFQGLDAYLWIRNSETMVRDSGSEWLLVRAPGWTFPTATPGCCDNALPTEWSVGDLTSNEVPVFGSQNGVQGMGSYTYNLPSTLQTYTLGASAGEDVPEPGPPVMVLLLGLMVLLDRSRLWSAGFSRRVCLSSRQMQSQTS